jgi:sterol desaturase/sphingolipid hydroxylase (fatty acid hydroxylase superfamily)
MPQEMGIFLINFLRLCAWLMIMVMIFVPLERLFPLRRQQVLRPAILQDLGLFFLNGLIATAILSIPLAAVVALSYQIVPEAYYAAIEKLPLPLRLTAIFAIGELGFYWGHRWSHQAKWLWRFHAVHHQPAALDWLVNTRAHPLDIVVTRLCGLVPIYILGLGRSGTGAEEFGPALLTVAGTTWSFFIHANLRWRLGWFEYVVSSPCFHHWHHSRDTYLNRNFSPMLPFYDYLFGTLHLPGSEWPQNYGIRAGNSTFAVPDDAEQPDTPAIKC